MIKRFSLEGRTALVTGASSGIGAHLVDILADAGAHVIAGARRKERVDACVKGVREAGGSAYSVTLDVSNEDSVIAAFDKAEEVFGTVDLLINNAGIGEFSKFYEMTSQHWDKVMETNLKGAWCVAREATARMRTAGLKGSVVNIASVNGLGASQGLAAYSISKWGIVGMTQSMAIDLVEFGIRVNTLSPGVFDTEIHQGNLQTEDGKAFIQEIPMKRQGELRELDGAVLLLASDAGSFITGSNLVVDGGHTIRRI